MELYSDKYFQSITLLVYQITEPNMWRESGEGIYIYIYIYVMQNIVIVCMDLSGKEPHRQVGVGTIVT